MSLTQAMTFSCPYCMSVNDIEIDVQNDVGQCQIVDCQICCRPINVFAFLEDDALVLTVKTEDE